MTKKFFTLLLAVAASIGTMRASDTQVDGIWYDFDSSTKTASVTYRGNDYDSYDNDYSGSVVIPASVTYLSVKYSVTSIGDDAFAYCTGLTSVTIPNSVTSIGEGAFWSSGLTSVTIPNSVTSIGDGAFFYCSGLTSVTIGNSVTSIGGAFEGCSGLTKVNITDIAAWCNIAFSGNGSNPLYYANHLYVNDVEVTNLVIPVGVTSIGDEAFAWCDGLTSVTIGNSVTSIGSSAFQNCSGLTSVTIGNSVTSIGEYAFDECNNITSVIWNAKNCAGYNFGSQVTSFTFGDEVEVIPEGLCGGMTKLTSITIPNSVTSIGDRAFSSCSGLTSVTIGNSVTSIGEHVFYQCSGLTSVTIPNSVTSIGESAFWGSGLTSVTIPNSVTSIGDRAFAYCSGLTSVTIGNSVTSIGEEAFSSCKGLTSVTIGNSVTSIGKYAFSGCSGLTSVTIGNSVTSIGESAFAYCSVLTSVTLNSNAIVSKNYSKDSNLKTIFGGQVTEYIIGDDVTSIGEYAFWNCAGLTSVTIGNSVTSIGNKAFYECFSLTTVTIPNSVTSIGDGAFYYCKSLTSITIPNSITSIGNNAFYECTGLTSVHISDIAAWCAISFGGYVANPLYYAHNLYLNGELVTDLVIPNSVTSIGEFAFYNCSGLTSVTIPNSVISIGGYAFYYCSGLTSVTIGNSVTSIGDDAFSYCTGLTSVTIEAETPPTLGPTLGKDAFYNTNECPIYVPCNAVNAYKTAWGYAYRIVANCASYTITFVNWDGSNLQTTSVTEGEMPQYTGSTPARPDDEEYTYTFSGWTPAIVAVTEDATYTATFTAIPIEEKDITTCAEAAEAALSVSGDNVLYNNGQEYTLTGYVTEIANAWNSTYNTTSFWMADTQYGGYVLKAFRAVCNSQAAAPQIGDYVRVTGKLTKYGTTPEVAEGCTYVILKRGSSAEESETTKVAATPTEEGSVILEWPAVENADTYILTITKNGTVICTLTFDAEGHLISIGFAAPSRDGNNHNAPAAEQAANGWKYVVTGLEPNAQYAYTMSAKQGETVLFTETVDFTMPSSQGIEDIRIDAETPTKILKDGQIYILRADHIFDAQGKMVK